MEPVGTSCVTNFEVESRDFTIESQSIPTLHQSSPRTHPTPLKIGHLQTQNILVRKPSNIPTVSQSYPRTHTQNMCCLCILYPEIAKRKSQYSTNSMVCFVFSGDIKWKHLGTQDWGASPGSSGSGLDWFSSVERAPFNGSSYIIASFVIGPLEKTVTREDLCSVEFPVLIMFGICGVFIMWWNCGKHWGHFTLFHFSTCTYIMKFSMFEITNKSVHCWAAYSRVHSDL
jgi:hypothetical protein